MKKRVLLGMSGGLDSSVAALLLQQDGYDVVGVTIKTYKYEEVGGDVGNETSCCSLDGINDARRVANMLGIPHYVYDFTEPFSREIIDYFIAGYLAGETPNPCTMCNRKIKWAELIRRADAIGADFIATGHYARVDLNNTTGRYQLRRGLDDQKDQSYALWAVTQESLARTIFPLSKLNKGESRKIAEEHHLPVAGKRESYEICFIPDDDYRRFLKENVSGLADDVSDGDVIYKGESIGKHQGFPFYTVGQRKGLGLSIGKPVYVINIDPKQNQIEVGDLEELDHRGLIARNVNMVSYSNIAQAQEFSVRIRYRDSGAKAMCRTLLDGTLEVIFNEPRRAITPGQSVVLYDGETVVAGGVISHWFAPD